MKIANLFTALRFAVLFFFVISAPLLQAETDTTSKLKNQETFMSNTFLVKTNFGDIQIELDAAAAPKTVENFIKYVESGHYNDTIFHRVIPGFMLQGGGFTEDMQQKSTMQPIPNEADNGLKNDRGTLAMARTMVPDSATSQFFINLVDNDFLNFQSKTQQGWGYAVFGKVVSGMDVVDNIATVGTGRKAGHADVPTETVKIESIAPVE